MQNCSRLGIVKDKQNENITCAYVFLEHVKIYRLTRSGAGTNLKVGGGAGKPTSGAKRLNFLSCPSNFLAVQLHLVVSRFGERLRGGQYSLVSL